MGVIYSVIPVTEESRLWLKEMGADVPTVGSRYPLIGEIYDTLNHLDGCVFEADRVREGQSWDAEITDDRDPPTFGTRMTILKCRAPSEPQEFHFSKGSSSLVFRILASLANRCGTLAVSADGEDVFLIPPDGYPGQLHIEWLKSQGTTPAEQGAAPKP